MCSNAPNKLLANSGPRAVGVPTNNQKGRGSLEVLFPLRFGPVASYNDHRLLVRVQESSDKAVEGPRTNIHLDDHLVILSTSKIFYYFRAQRD